MASNLITLNIDGREVKTKQGATVLAAALDAGIYIPTLCYHPKLEPYGGCRMCIVEIEKMRGLPPSCTTPATDGMVVKTNTPQLQGNRRSVMEFILTEHPHSCLTCWRRRRCRQQDICLRNAAVTDRCVTCPKNQRCELQQVSDYLGFAGTKQITLPYKYRGLPWSREDPFIDRDNNLCILCGRCIRACQDIRVNGAIAFANRGGHSVVCTAFDCGYKAAGSEFCGTCVDVCPVGAIMERRNKWAGLPDRKVSTTCAYCGVGCKLQLEVKNNTLIRVSPDPTGPANEGFACVKGRFGITEMVHSPQRLTAPLIKQANGEFKAASWDEALSLVASKLSTFKPNELGIFAAGKCTNEDNFVMQKFARVVLGTQNIDHCARLCHAPSVTGLAQAFGSGAMTNPISDILESNCLFVIGSNTTAAHPVIGIKIKQATRQGKKLIVANPLEIELTKFADIWLRHVPGSDVALLMGMCRAIIEAGAEDKEFIANRTEDYETFKASLEKFTPEFVSKVTGVAWAEIQRAALMYAKNGPSAIVYAMGITQSTHGHDNVLSTANLSMLTGNIGKPGSGVNPLRGHNNVQGACDMGGLPDVYPGYQKVSDPAAREKFEKAWGVKLSPQPGLTLSEFIHDAYQGKIKSIYLMGENIALSEPCVRMCQGAMEELQFLVVQDLYLTETAKLAHVVLPACSFAEKDGTFTSTERRIQRVRAALEPIGNSKPDWWIISQLAKRMGGKGFDYNHPSEIMDEAARLTPQYGGVSYARLEKEGSLQWPCPTADHPGTPRLHIDKFSRGKGKFSPLEYRPPAELPDAEYPLMLTTRRSLFQFHTGTMSRKVPGLNELKPDERIDMNPVDAQKLGIQDGEMVSISSRRGQLEAKVTVTEGSPLGLVAMTFHFIESPTNVLTNPAVDPVSKIPEYKVCAVKVEKIHSAAEKVAVRS